MRKRLVIALILILVLIPTVVAQAQKPAPSLRGTTEYDFVGIGPTWEGTVSLPDGEYTIKWWGEPGTPTTGQVFHFIERWEILDGDDLLLAGVDIGTTTIRHGKNSTWRTNGIVTEAYEDFENWIGRQVHMSGHFTWAAPGLPDHGIGIFRIN